VRDFALAHCEASSRTGGEGANPGPGDSMIYLRFRSLRADELLAMSISCFGELICDHIAEDLIFNLKIVEYVKWRYGVRQQEVWQL
jgi:hypothetical protein